MPLKLDVRDSGLGEPAAVVLLAGNSIQASARNRATRVRGGSRPTIRAVPPGPTPRCASAIAARVGPVPMLPHDT